MTPKLTNEMRDALARGEVVDVGDGYLVPKTVFMHLQGLNQDADAATHEELRRLIQEGIDSGPGVPADEAFAELREHASRLAQS